jgi:hypothetical protein
MKQEEEWQAQRERCLRLARETTDSKTAEALRSLAADFQAKIDRFRGGAE